MATVYNLHPNPSFISNTNSWTGYASGNTAPTISLDSSDPLYGTGYSAKVTFAASAPDSGIITGSSSRVLLVSGDVYTISAYVKVPTGQATSSFRIRAYFYTASTGSDLESIDSAPVEISSHDGWVRLSLTFTTPATRPYFRLWLYRTTSTDPGAGYYFLVDAVQLQTGSEATPLIYDQGQKNKLVDKALAKRYIDHLVGMKLGADIKLGDFVFNRIDEYGVVWVVSDVEGWWNLPQVDMQDLPRGWGDGSYTTYGRYGARQITITGSFVLQDPDTQLEAARERLINAINLVKRDAWLILDEETPKALKVRLSGTPSISTVDPKGRTDFSIGLVSADPIKYKWADARDDGYALTTANSNAEVVTIRNDGNTPVGAIYEIIGPTTGPVSLFNRTSEQLMDVIYKLDKYKVFTVTGAQVADGNMTFTTNTTHGLAVGDSVDVLNVVDMFDISSIVSTVANTVDIVTTLKHNFSVGQRLYLTRASSLTGFANVTNNEYQITSVYAGTDDYKFTVTRTGLVQAIAASQSPGTGNAKFAVWSNLSSIAYTSDNSTALITTAAAHGFDVGDQIILSNTSVVFNGTHTVVATPSDSTFELTFSESQTIVPITYYESTLELGTIRFATNAISSVANDYVTIQSLNEDFNGTYKVVSANTTALTFNKSFQNTTANTASTFGTVYISKISDRSSTAYANGRAYYGNIYNGYYTVDSLSTSNPDKFTIIRPTYYANVSNATITTYDGATSPVARVYAETLSIDTYTRDIALNGEIGGYRSKLDTVVDWIELQPGDNEIIFEDLNKKSVTYVAFTTSGNTATITTKSDHNFVVGSQVKLIGLDTVAGGSNVFANASTATVATIPDSKSFTFTPTNYSGASTITSTPVTSGYIYEVSSAFVNIYYRSGWIG